MVELSHCPRCRRPLVRSTTLRPGRVVLACRECRRLTVPIDGVEWAWIEAGDGWQARMERLIDEGEARKAVAESEGDDPRWRPA